MTEKLTPLPTRTIPTPEPAGFARILLLYEAGRIGELREQLSRLDGFEATQMTAALLDAIGTRHGLTMMATLMDTIRRWDA